MPRGYKPRNRRTYNTASKKMPPPPAKLLIIKVNKELD